MRRTQGDIFCGWAAQGLVWLPERGMGYYPVRPDGVYDEQYFAKYMLYAETPRGRHLNEIRTSLVARHAGREAALIDVGIGCGAFIEERGPGAWGFDVNPAGVAWLEDRGLFRDPRQDPAPILTFWDSLEHIPEPGPFLAGAQEWAFVSLPIFRDADHVLRSRHFRRDEHCWYWTRGGFIAWMGEHGFSCVEHGTPESLAGREDIHTFVFRRERDG